jgi:hypothetical protein
VIAERNPMRQCVAASSAYSQVGCRGQRTHMSSENLTIINGLYRRYQFQHTHYHACLEKHTKLGGCRRSGQRDQLRPRTRLCHTSQQPHDRTRGRQPLGLRLQSEGGCSSDRRSCIARSVQVLRDGRYRVASGSISHSQDVGLTVSKQSSK